MAAGDFTNIRVESIAHDANILRYDYAGASAISIYRALHDGSFSLIRFFPTDYGSTGSPFYDNDVTPEVYYDYKLSDDAGSTFTALVSVTTQKQFPIGAHQDSKHVNLPAIAQQEDITPQTIQQMVDELQAVINGETIAAPRPCHVCPSNGALVLDCTTGCYRFIISAVDAADVNSISINCESLELDFDLPDATTIEVCGWPESTKFTGDECFQAPISSSSIESFSVVIKEKPPCARTRIRIPAFPCAGEYTKDCYDDGSLIWTSAKFNFSLTNCTSTNSGSGCCAGNFNHISHNGSWAATMLSGDARTRSNAGDTHALAGYSIFFGKPGTGTSLRDLQLEFGSFVNATEIKGNPRFGVAINVPESATVVDFSGLVLLADYQRDLWVFGTYANANLQNGDTPTVISSAAMSGTATPSWFRMSNYPSLGSGIFEIDDVDINTLFSFSDTGHSAGTPDLVGVGMFWLGNTASSDLHAAKLYVSSNNSSIQIG